MGEFHKTLTCRSEVLQWTGKNFFRIVRLSGMGFRPEKDGSLLLKKEFTVLDEKNPPVQARIPPLGWIVKDVLGNFEILEDVDFCKKYSIDGEEPKDGGEPEGEGEKERDGA